MPILDSIDQQFISTLAALILFSALALLTQKRTQGLIYIFAWQSFFLVLATAFQAVETSQYEIYFSALLTFALKVVLIPYFLNILVNRLHLPRDSKTVAHSFYVLLGASLLVVFCYHIITPIDLFPSLHTKNIVVVAMSVMLLGMLLMIVRRDVLTHVIGFMVMENGLFFAALMATQGIPMVVELGVAFDLLVAVILFGVFFFHIRTSIDSMDVDSLNRLREDRE